MSGSLRYQTRRAADPASLAEYFRRRYHQRIRLFLSHGGERLPGGIIFCCFSFAPSSGS